MDKLMKQANYFLTKQVILHKSIMFTLNLHSQEIDSISKEDIELPIVEMEKEI